LRDRAPRRRNRNPGEFGKHVLGAALAVLALGCLSAGAYVYLTAARPPVLDRASLCPVDGPRSVTAVLLDSTDEIPDIGKRQIRTLLLDMAETLPAYALLDLRLLDPLGDLARAHPERRQRSQARFHAGIRQPLRMQLLIDVAVEPHRAHALDVAGARAERHPVQDVGNRRLVCRPRRGRRARHGSRCEGEDNEEPAHA